MYYFVVLFFFFKQKTAYELRISDWSSDVCSSDLVLRRERPGTDEARIAFGHALHRRPDRNHLRRRFRARCADPRRLRSRLRSRRSDRAAAADARRLRGRVACTATGRMPRPAGHARSEEHTSELQSLMRSSYAVFFL